MQYSWEDGRSRGNIPGRTGGTARPCRQGERASEEEGREKQVIREHKARRRDWCTHVDEAVVEVEAEELAGEGGVTGDLLPGDAADDGVHAGAAPGVEVVGQAGVGLEQPRPGAAQEMAEDHGRPAPPRRRSSCCGRCDLSRPHLSLSLAS
jgi:hypothetical protein